MKVIEKRNGEKVAYDINKILNAINKAFDSTKESHDKNLIKSTIENWDSIPTNVEDIQTKVVKTLLELKYYDTALAYERYRHRRTLIRQETLEKSFKEIERYLEVGDNENSNKKTDVANVKRDLIAGEYFKARKRKVMPKELLKLHEDRAIYIHDFDQWEQLTNCNIANLEDMLMNGTFVTNAYIKQPNSIQTAFNIASQIALSIANQEYGGISYANINETMSFFAKKNFRKNFIDTFRLVNNVPNSSLDDIVNNIEKRFGKIDSGNDKLKLEYERCFNEALNKTDKDIYDACQIFEYQVNSLSAQSQTPFITITFNIPTNWESERVVVNYLEVRNRGLGKEYGKNTTIFPKLSYFVVDGYNLKEGDKYYWLTKEVSKCMSRNVYPDILNISKIDYDKGRYFARMGKHIQPNNN